MRKAPAIREQIQRLEAELKQAEADATMEVIRYAKFDKDLASHVTRRMLDLDVNFIKVERDYYAKSAQKLKLFGEMLLHLNFSLAKAEEDLRIALEEDNETYPLPDQFKNEERLVESLMSDYMVAQLRISQLLESTPEGKQLVYSRDYAKSKLDEAVIEAKRLAKEIAERNSDITGTIGETGAFQVAITHKVRPAGSTFDLTGWLDRVADLPSVSAKTIAAIEKGISFSSSLVDILQNEEYKLACGTPLVNIETELVPKFMEGKLIKRVTTL